MDTKKKALNYSEAVAEIDSILARFDREEFDVDTLAAQVKRATELIRLCKEKLRKSEEDVAKALADD